METIELLNNFLDTYSQTTKVSYTSVMKPWLLSDFEKKIGKRLVEFNSDDIVDFIKVCYDNERSKKCVSATAYANNVASVYKKFYEWYIENHELIRNPINSNAKAVLEKYMSDSIECTLSKEEVEEAIRKIPIWVDPDYAKFCELLIRLYFEGIQTSKDLLTVKWDAFDKEEKTIDYNGVKLHISDRLCELLEYNSNETQIYIYRHLLYAARWNNSLIKVFSRDQEASSRDIRSIVTVVDKIYKVNFIDNGFNHGYKQVYYCGLYNYLVSQVGKEAADAMILSKDRMGDNDTFKRLLYQYGAKMDGGITYLKNTLELYITR